MLTTSDARPAPESAAPEGRPVRVLVVDDDEDDYLIARDLLGEIEGCRFEVQWLSDPEAALGGLAADEHDICLLDYRLGRHNGLDVLRRAVARGITVPIILMTGQEDGDVDREAVRVGASDYLVKGRINAILLDRAIRYARQQRETLEALRRQTEFVSAILDTAGALVVVLDRAGRIVRFNRQCERTTGYRAEEVEGRVFWEFLLGDEERDRVRGVFADLTTGLGAAHHENDWIAQSGERRRIAWANTYLFGLDGSPEYIVATGIDVTERRAAEEALALAREREVEVGASIQRTLLVRNPPADLPGIVIGARSLPSQKIGGDYFDFIRLADGLVDVLVGDVMGKGVPAALLAAATKNHFQRAARRLGYALAPYGRAPEPEEIVSAVHANLTRELYDLNSFVTLAYARFDQRRGLVTFVDCGHPRPLRVVGATSAVERVSGDNVPLGMSERELYRQVTVPYGPEDVFFFYSDGLTEAPNRDDPDDLFGEDRLAGVIGDAARRGLGPAEIAEEAFRVVRAFAGDGAAEYDDLTCVAVRVGSEAAPRRAAHAVLEIASDADLLERARDFVGDFLAREAADAVDEDARDLLALAVNEALANVIEHACGGRTDCRIQIEAEAYPAEVRFRLYDNGEPFRAGRAAVPEPSFDGSRDSGFGIFIMEQCFDRVEHTRDEVGRNCTTLVKRLAAV